MFFYSPEAMGLVTGCIFLVSLFLFIPFPFSNFFFKDDNFSHEEVSSFCFIDNLINHLFFLVCRTNSCDVIYLLYDFTRIC